MKTPAFGKIGRAAAVAALAACGATSTGAQQLTPVRYNEVIHTIFFLPSYIAQQNGYFKEEGLDVKAVTGWGSEKTIAALMGGSADIVLLGPESAVYIENSPSPEKTKIFCKLTAKDGLLVVSRAKISPKDFKWSMVKGKQYMDWRVATTPQIDSLYVFKKYGLNPGTDFTYITNISSGNREQAWLAGKGDFATFFEPVVSLLERDGKGHVVTSLASEIGEFAYTVFMAKDKYLAENPKVAQSWCNAIYKAQVFVAKAGPAELAKAAAPYFPGLDHGLLLNSIKRYQALGVWSTDVTTDKAALEKVQDILISGGVIKAEQRVPYEKTVIRTFSENSKKLAVRPAR